MVRVGICLYCSCLTELEVGGKRQEAGGQEECDSRSVGSGLGPASGMFAFSNIVFILCIRSQHL